MSPKQIAEACVRWVALVPILALLSLAIMSGSAWMVQAHAEGTHRDHVTRNEYDQFARLLWDRLDRMENKLDQLNR